MPEKKEKFNFTKAYRELEKINEWFQQEDIDLEEGLKKYKRGLELVEQCRERLKEIQNRFYKIKKEHSIEESKRKEEQTGDKEIDVKDIPF